MEKRWPNNCVLNACSTYGRLLVTFILHASCFPEWYITLNLGLQGLGLVGLAAGSFGLSMALERGSDAAIGRELAEAIAKRDRGEISRVSAATFAVCVLLGLLVVGITLVLIPVILSGNLNLETQGDNVQRAFSMLLLCHGLAGSSGRKLWGHSGEKPALPREIFWLTISLNTRRKPLK